MSGIADDEKHLIEKTMDRVVIMINGMGLCDVSASRTQQSIVINGSNGSAYIYNIPMGSCGISGAFIILINVAMRLLKWKENGGCDKDKLQQYLSTDDFNSINCL